MMFMDCKAQVSLEYLLTVLFSVVLAMIAAILALNITTVATAAQAKIRQFRTDSIASLLQ
ncbi:MAG: hypothetical protein Q7K42_00830 [Candidatus Diapherotrites archaeon]|nr:hypothetical protein [Candidatus Diapherotrites archaeon]